MKKRLKHGKLASPSPRVTGGGQGQLPRLAFEEEYSKKNFTELQAEDRFLAEVDPGDLLRTKLMLRSLDASLDEKEAESMAIKILRAACDADQLQKMRAILDARRKTLQIILDNDHEIEANGGFDGYKRRFLPPIAAKSAPFYLWLPTVDAYGKGTMRRPRREGTERRRDKSLSDLRDMVRREGGQVPKETVTLLAQIWNFIIANENALAPQAWDEDGDVVAAKKVRPFPILPVGSTANGTRFDVHAAGSRVLVRYLVARNGRKREDRTDNANTRGVGHAKAWAAAIAFRKHQFARDAKEAKAAFAGQPENKQ